MKRVLAALLLAALAVASAGADDWLSVVEIKLAPPDDGKQIVSVRLTPARTEGFDLLEFECVYRQELPWRDPQGKPQVKIVEPVTFIYRRKEVKLTHELDFHCSFHAPVSEARLAAAYGDRTFVAGVPVRIHRVRVRALVQGAPVWSYEFAAPGLHEVKAAPPPPPPVKPPAGAAFGEVDLD